MTIVRAIVVSRVSTRLCRACRPPSTAFIGLDLLQASATGFRALTKALKRVGMKPRLAFL